MTAEVTDTAVEYDADYMRFPAPYFGGKSTVADEVWRRFGECRNYLEPFAGSAAVLLRRPRPFAGVETVNDLNGWIANVLRALGRDPEAVAWAADRAVVELDLHALGDSLFYPEHHQTAAARRWYGEPLDGGSTARWAERLRDDPDYCDPEMAGVWLWGASSWIGDNWGRVAENARKVDGEAVAVVRASPDMYAGGKGYHRRLAAPGERVRRKMPDTYNPRGVHRQRPDIHTSGGSGVAALRVPGVARKRPQCHGDRARYALIAGHPDMSPALPRGARLLPWFLALYQRLRYVRICCGDWTRVTGNTPLRAGGSGYTAVFLDPPYDMAGRDRVYGDNDSATVAADVRAWCVAHGGAPTLRIALCGYDEHGALAGHGWQAFRWQTGGGYGNQRQRGERNRNGEREVIWFSPACLSDEVLL